MVIIARNVMHTSFTKSYHVQCQISDCGTPTETGYAFTGTETTYGETFNVTCATGYTGTVDRTNVPCLESGNWSTVSGCTIIG